MALTHHIIIQYCFMKHNVPKNMRKYCVIGDDMAISGDKVASEYIRVIESLGMEISLGKSVIPSQLSNSAEIAKRYFRNGIELSPITPKQISLATNGLNDLLSLERSLFDRGFYPAITGEENSTLKEITHPRALSRESIITSFLKRIKKSERYSAYIFCTSPLFKTITGFELPKTSHPISRLHEVLWGKLYGFQHQYEQFLTKLLAEKIVDYEQSSRELLSSTFRADKETYSPLVDSFFKTSIDEMKKILCVYNTPYEGEEGDSDDLLDQTDPAFVMFEILSRPNPADKPLFQRRFNQKIKLKESILIKFLKSNWMVKLPPITILDK